MRESARTDLCGGCQVTGIPTATPHPRRIEQIRARHNGTHLRSTRFRGLVKRFHPT